MSTVVCPRSRMSMTGTDEAKVLLSSAMYQIRKATEPLLKRRIFEHEWNRHLQEIQTRATEVLEQFLEVHPEINFPLEVQVRREEGTDDVIVRFKTPTPPEQLN